ncbi:MAG TPA: VTT domain-containing protein [Planctomycetota bacterium]|nr:VTT domain-containing protein [Planctomycetota bacterium]
MESLLDIIGRYGGPVIFALIFLDQLGFPIPTAPLLLALGALAGSGRIEPLTALLFGLCASLCADWLWYQLGRWKGQQVLGTLCRAALEPDSCVSRTHGLFTRYGVKSLLIAKFVPGFDTVAPPIAGITGVRLLPFLAWSGGGALAWLLAFGGLGYLFSDRLEELAGTADRLGGTLVLGMAGLIAIYAAWKFAARQRVLRSVRMARITPEELHALMQAGDGPAILDARSRGALEALPQLLPGALLLTFEEIEARQHEVPRDRDVVVYCS